MSLSIRQPLRTFANVGREARSAMSLCAGSRSKARLVTDIVLYRVLRLGHVPGENHVRSIRMRTGRQISYRLNRGDIQSIREVLLDQAYRPPFALAPRVIVDLGANIGLTSAWLADRYHPDVLVAVEPNPANAELARRNLAGLPAHVVEAAIGPRDGTAWFLAHRDSNLGSVTRGANGSDAIPMLSVPTLLRDHGIETVDLLKMDIEGGEQDLLDGDTEWLAQVGAVIAEFHPDQVDYPGLVQRLANSGFRYFPAGSAWPGSMDAFVRDATPADRA